MAVETASERRKTLRVDLPGRVEIALVSSSLRLEANSVNLSEAGVCVRLQEPLDISAQVQLRLFSEPLKRPVECGGRIAWVVQRLDLRDAPPFLYDVGVEFLKPPARLRQLAARAGIILKAAPERPDRLTDLQPLTVGDRCYVPRLQSEPGAVVGRWHLVVRADGAPCISQRFDSAKDATDAWQQFKRQVAKPAVARSRR